MNLFRRIAPILLVGALVACSGSSNAEPEVTAPPPTRSPATETTPTTNVGDTTIPATIPATPTTQAPPTITGSTTTQAPPADTTTTAPEPGAFLPVDLGTPVDGAPGIDSPGETVELVDNVWLFVPTAADPDDANVHPPLPEDVEIITAYAEAQAAYHEQASMNPLPAEPSENVQAALADGGARLAENIFEPKAAAGQHLDLTEGIVLRPVVIADPRSDTEAFIFDCQLDGTVFVNSDGTLAEGQTPGVKEFPQIASIVRVGDTWLVERLTQDERACV